MSNKSNVNITLDKDVIRLVDMDRGQQPRSSFINSILSKFLKKNKVIFDWGEESRLAEEDIKTGRVKKFSSKHEAVKWLKN